jgi:hypothetical protein
VNSGSYVRISPLNTFEGWRASSAPSWISSLSPMKNGGLATCLPSGSAMRIVAMSGSPRKLRTSTFSTRFMNSWSSRTPLTVIEAEATWTSAGISRAAGG